MHEAELQPRNCFITLTYTDDHLPENRTLVKKHFQDFLKRLRKKYPKIRYFHCGEYGETYGRPHYHACLFNIDFRDKKLWKTVNDFPYYKSEELDRIWGKGMTVIGTVTFESAAYVARYIVKKVTGKNALEHYNEINKETGEILSERIPEYTTMSRRPGIGKLWYEKYQKDIFPDDFVLTRGAKVIKTKVPKYYSAMFELDNQIEFEKIKFKRRMTAKKFNNQPFLFERRLAAEFIKKAKLKLLKRNLE